MSTDYTLIRSQRETLALEVNRQGQVVVRAPRHVSQTVIDDFLRRQEDWVQANLARRQAWLADHPEPSPQEMEALRQRAKELLPPLVDQYAQQMGLRPQGITITSARTRFGSCSGKNRLAFSWRLMTYPMAAIEYVVVHELAHIVHKNHGPGFYALVETWLPDWRERQALLRT